jgi:hypothetical protein
MMCEVVGTYRAVDLRMSSLHMTSKAMGTRISGGPPVSGIGVWVGEPLTENPASSHTLAACGGSSEAKTSRGILLHLPQSISPPSTSAPLSVTLKSGCLSARGTWPGAGIVPTKVIANTIASTTIDARSIAVPILQAIVRHPVVRRYKCCKDILDGHGQSVDEMSSRTVSWLAWSLWALSVALTVTPPSRPGCCTTRNSPNGGCASF